MSLFDELFKAMAAGGASGDKLAGIALNPEKPAEMRAKILVDVFKNVNNDPAIQLSILTAVLQKASASSADAEVESLKERYEQALAELEQGPIRPATVIGLTPIALPGVNPKAHVITPDGQERYPALHPSVTPAELTSGRTVYLDAKGAMVLGVDGGPPRSGPQATFLRRLHGTDQVEVRLEEKQHLYYAAAPLLDALQKGELEMGDRVLVCPRRQFAFVKVPQEKDHRHRFVAPHELPDIVPERDIGKPHWILNYLIQRTRILLFRPELLKQFNARPRVTAFLTGPSGSGKSFTIGAFSRRYHDMLIERTGRHDLGSRIIRVKPSQLLSEWLGQSDKNAEELVDVMYTVASTPVETAGGEKILLPLLVIFEEAEGLARRRGEYDGAVYDRIIGTLLQRLDDPMKDLGKLPLILITTSNRPDLVDSAMFRRIAGVRARFSRLDHDGLAAVLNKKLKPNYPFVSHNGHAPEQVRRHIIDQVVAGFFSPNGEDRALVEITLRDGAKLARHHRDFLTGAVVEQAVANTIDRNLFAAESGQAEIGLSGPGLIEALRRHIDGIADVLTAHNVADYLELPEHTAAANVRRLRGPNGHLASLIM